MKKRFISQLFKRGKAELSLDGAIGLWEYNINSCRRRRVYVITTLSFAHKCVGKQTNKTVSAQKASHEIKGDASKRFV